MKVSVIIPVYNVENFIVKCAESLFRQTLDDVEYIFVDDASPDKSMALLEQCIQKFPEKKSQIHILRHEINKGLPAARNTGLTVACGEYIFHCDSDDFVDKEMLEVLYSEAVMQKADFVWCDWYLSFEKNERYMKQSGYKTPVEALKAMLSGAMKFTVWNKLVKRSLYVEHDIKFPEGYGMGEDMTMIMLCSCATTVAYVPRAFYHYVKLNASAYTQNFTMRHLSDLKYNISRIESFIYNKFGNSFEQEIAFLKLDIKYPFLISSSSEKYHLWKALYPEVNCYIGKNKLISFRANALQWCASKGYFFFVRLHYYFLQKIIYGIIYK